jgi:hypothetical protein
VVFAELNGLVVNASVVVLLLGGEPGDDPRPDIAIESDSSVVDEAGSCRSRSLLVGAGDRPLDVMAPASWSKPVSLSNAAWANIRQISIRARRVRSLLKNPAIPAKMDHLSHA